MIDINAIIEEIDSLPAEAANAPIRVNVFHFEGMDSPSLCLSFFNSDDPESYYIFFAQAI